MFSARLGVKDLQRELRFYEGVGFEVEQIPGGARVTFGEAAFTLEAYDEMRIRDAPLLDWDMKPGLLGHGVQLYLFVDDVDEIQRSIPRQIAQPWPVQDKRWGLRELTLRTPSGYLVTFAQRR